MTPCKKCDAKCCRYIALQIDTPKCKHDFENIRWYLTHKRIAIFIDKRRWYLEVFTPCRYLGQDNLCTIYYKRPIICREHSTKDCEFVDGDFHHEYYFKNLESFDAYLKKRFEKKKGRSSQRKKRP